MAHPHLSTDSVPIVDIAGFLAGDPIGCATAAAQLRYAMENIGFFTLLGHGIEPGIVSDALAQAKRFFDEPLDKKMEIKVGTGRTDSEPMLATQRGYILYGGTSASKRTEVDLRSKNYVESLYITRESDRSTNQWPGLAGFKEAQLAYYEAIDALSFDLLGLYAVALDLPRNYFELLFNQPVSGLRLSHYFPARSQEEVEDSWGFVPHTDRSFFTLLPANPVSGLEIKPENLDWMNVPFIPDSFVVNGGDVLKRWTNDRFLSTPHRVTRVMVDRYAMPLFYSPNWDVVLHSLPTCVTAERPEQYAPIAFEDFLRTFLGRDYVYSDKRLNG